MVRTRSLLLIPAIALATFVEAPLLPARRATELLPAERPANDKPSYRGFHHPERVEILGYDGDAMEPFLTRDGCCLLFNNRNDPAIDTDLHWAERLDETTFTHRGRIEGIASPGLDAVATVDEDGRLFFVSDRSKQPKQPFGVPQRLHGVNGFVEAPSLAPDQLSLYYHQREAGRFAIYRVSRSRR